MRKPLSLILIAFLSAVVLIQSGTTTPHLTLAQGISDLRRIPAPEDVLGFRPGDDRKLASWAKVLEYFQKLAGSSDRVKFEDISKTTMAAPFVYSTIRSPDS